MTCSLVDRLGAPEDDTREDGIFTKRMLLLLESRVLVGESAYEAVVDRVIDAYWMNAELHPDRYQPLVLVNDIVRWWRIVLLNHESSLRKRQAELMADGDRSDEDKGAALLAERRYRSYKMRLARCLTCFSALTYLLALAPSDDSHIRKEQVREMVGLTPLERLTELPTLAGRALAPVEELGQIYASYLERSDQGKSAMLEALQRDSALAQQISASGGRFTQLMFELLQDLGGGRRLHRHMLV